MLTGCNNLSNCKADSFEMLVINLFDPRHAMHTEKMLDLVMEDRGMLINCRSASSLHHPGGPSPNRLKPPPYLINYENKKIKLTTANRSAVQTTSCLVSTDTSPVVNNGCTPEKRSSQVVTVGDAALNKSLSVESSKATVSSSSLVGKTTVGATKRASNTDDSVETKKFKPAAITWP